MTWLNARRALIVMGATALVPCLFYAQQVTFQSRVDLVAVDTQVVDRDGQPIGNLTVDNFQVWINGQARKVVSADLIQYPTTAPRSLVLPAIQTPDVIQRSDLPEVTGRVIVLAVDEVSFPTAAMQQAVLTAKRFVSSLPEEDVIGLYAYPFGAGALHLVHYHNQVNLALNRLQGFKQAPTNSLNLSPSEAIDIVANDTTATNAVYERECLVMVGSRCVDKDDVWAQSNVGGLKTGTTDPVFVGEMATYGSCMRTLRAEARDYAAYVEMMSAESFAGLQDLLQNLARISGPKIVMLMSAGIVASDRAGGRPDASGMMAHAGQMAAAANASLYTLHMDGSFSNSVNQAQRFGPCQGRMSGGLVSSSRDGDLAAFGLQRMAAAAGGEYFRITAGNGDKFFQRVLTETSAYYVLGVQPEPVDRDGRAHFIRVKTVDVKNATLHFRTQVTIPKPDGAK